MKIWTSFIIDDNNPYGDDDVVQTDDLTDDEEGDPSWSEEDDLELLNI